MALWSKQKKETRIEGLERNERMCLHVRQILPSRSLSVYERNENEV